MMIQSLDDYVGGCALLFCLVRLCCVDFDLGLCSLGIGDHSTPAPADIKPTSTNLFRNIDRANRAISGIVRK
ncbi:unnamed protein product [Callosobruchus maculatus]|uniref:Uncharacterized protein n=1 Tax=Callosobruchus maculatus TaxID=64391 RepID=A0A653C2K7_CALMS|nr:unnamed protein product [Callosobruchus maculatus]